MPSEPQISILSIKYRQRFFWLLVLVFSLTLPALIFHTAGYRLSFENEETSIVTTGGMYITADNLEVDVYLDEEQVERPRLFRSAYYIQNIEAGQHRVVVQRPDLQTWVKVLPVDSHIVVEAAAFNMPSVPHIRPITNYVTATGTAVYLAKESIEEIFPMATTTEPIVIQKSAATSSLATNEEYVFVASLFSTTSTTSISVFELQASSAGRFGFATTSKTPTGTTTEELVIKNGDMEIVERDSELYVQWVGSANSIPYYFCVTDNPASTTAKRYGDHVALEIERLKLSTSSALIIDGERVCRPEIKLDRKWQDVYYYNFFPGNRDLVLLQLQDGLYVTEIDDRSWQNTQLLYPGDEFRVVIENEEIFVHENGRYFEVITEIEPL